MKEVKMGVREERRLTRSKWRSVGEKVGGRVLGSWLSFYSCKKENVWAPALELSLQNSLLLPNNFLTIHGTILCASP